MNLNNRLRFSRDVEYDLLVPPFGSDYYSMSPKQAKENFEWFISKIPERVEYLSNRIAEDVKIPVSELDLSPDSLKTVWRWFLKTARIEKTPKEQVAEMEMQWGHLGEHWIEREKLTVATQFIVRDIGMYFGETFTKNHSNVTWDYFTKPKNHVNAKKPLLYGFYSKTSNPPFSTPIDPILLIEQRACRIMSKSQREADLLELFVDLEKCMIDV